MEIEELLKLLKQAEDIQEYWLKDVENIPAPINIIELLHCDENAHTRILEALLNYEKGKFRKSFAKRVGLQNIDIDNATIKLEYPTKSEEKDGRIDMLIYKENEYVIILENKGNGAKEQDKQIDKYIEFLHNENGEKGYKEENIYCLYLTEKGGDPKTLIKEASTLGGQQRTTSYY